MKDLGTFKKIAGMKIIRYKDRGRQIITHKVYLRKVLKRFNMVDFKVVSLILISHFQLSINQSPRTTKDIEDMENVFYESSIECIMYSTIYSRPDIFQAISVTTRYMGNLEREHWNVFKWVLRYIKETQDIILIYY